MLVGRRVAASNHGPNMLLVALVTAFAAGATACATADATDNGVNIPVVDGGHDSAVSETGTTLSDAAHPDASSDDDAGDDDARSGDDDGAADTSVSPDGSSVDASDGAADASDE